MASTSPSPFKGTSDRQPCIISYCRTPIGGYCGSLSSLTAVDLGSCVIKESIHRAGIKNEQIDAVYMGQSISAGCGQGPARMAALKAGLPPSVSCTTVNKVCSSGMKAITLGCQEIMLGLREVVVCGGMESMSNAPHLCKQRKPKEPIPPTELRDSLLIDGLTDACTGRHMGDIAESYGTEYHFSREDQDAFAISSFTKAINATKNGLFKNEIVGVTINSSTDPVIVTEDEHLKRFNEEKIPKLKPAFGPTGTITAANSSGLNDAAAALVIASREFARNNHLNILAVIDTFADASVDPLQYGIAPYYAVQKCLDRSGITTEDIDYFEINEAFSVIALANAKLLSIPSDRLNLYGGAVGLGHPIGASGARIVCTLLSILIQQNKKTGCAAICNGGGEGMALIIKRE